MKTLAAILIFTLSAPHEAPVTTRVETADCETATAFVRVFAWADGVKLRTRCESNSR